MSYKQCPFQTIKAKRDHSHYNMPNTPKMMDVRVPVPVKEPLYDRIYTWVKKYFGKTSEHTLENNSEGELEHIIHQEDA